MLIACNPSRHYFNKRIGSGGRNREERKPAKEITDTNELAKPLALEPKDTLKPRETTDSTTSKKTTNTKPDEPYYIIGDDTVRASQINNDDVFNFERNKKRYKSRNDGALAAFFFGFFILLAVLVFLIGLFIYRTNWSIWIQCLVFLLFLLIGNAFVQLIMDKWRKAASRK